MRRGKLKLRRIHYDPRPDWIEMNVFNVPGKILEISDPVICEATLPNLRDKTQLRLCAMREATLDELNGAFQGDCRVRTDENVEVVWHYHEGM